VTRPVPRESAASCAPAAAERGDPMPGTALTIGRLLLVEQAGPWGPRGLVESRADPVLADRIDHAAAAGGARMQAVRRPGRHAQRGPVEPGHDVMLVDVAAGTTWRWRAESLAALADALEADPALRPAEAVADTEPSYLVCTHGSHDLCCAVRGRPVLRALAELRPDHVWETTHVGGDRFAANVLVVPTGDLYGRVTPDDALRLVEDTDAGRVLVDHLRGRLGLAPAAQVGLALAHERLGDARRAAVTVTSLERVDGETVAVHLAGPEGPLLATVVASWGDPERLTCRGAGPSRARVLRGVSLQ